MKKIFIAFFLMTLIFTSCANHIDEITTFESTSTIPMWIETKESTILAETTDSSSITVSRYDPNDYPDDPFESFKPFSNGRGTFFGKKDVFEIFYSATPIFIRFQVIDLYQETEHFTKYHVKVTHIYGSDMDFDREKIYVMNFLGFEKTPMYGRPMLEIGKEYGRFAGPSFVNQELMQASLIYKISDVGGITYVYGYGVDLSSAKCAVPIIDEQENAIYEVGKHDKILAYLQSIGQEIPVFEFKCEVNALLKEIREY